MLATAFLILGNPYIHSQESITKPRNQLDREQEEIQRSALMASDQIIKEMDVKDLGNFTAYKNMAIKAVF